MMDLVILYAGASAIIGVVASGLRVTEDSVLDIAGLGVLVALFWPLLLAISPFVFLARRMKSPFAHLGRRRSRIDLPKATAVKPCISSVKEWREAEARQRDSLNEYLRKHDRYLRGEITHSELRKQGEEVK